MFPLNGRLVRKWVSLVTRITSNLRSTTTSPAACTIVPLNIQGFL